MTTKISAFSGYFCLKFNDILTFIKKWQYFCHLKKQVLKV